MAAAAPPAAPHLLALRAVRLYLLVSGLHLVLSGSLLPEAAAGGGRPPRLRQEAQQEEEEASSLPWDSSAGAVALDVSRAVAAQFTPANASAHRLTHLALDPDRGDVYVGAVNRLYQLDGASLRPLHQVVTGPRLDSPSCHARGCGAHVRRAPADNHNKLLVVAPSVGAVIACGSVSQGACDKYRLGNLSVHLTYIPKSVAANRPDASTFAFVGPERYNAWEGAQALYVGTTFTTVGDYRHDVPAISTRNLKNLEYAEFSFAKQSLLRIDVKVRDHFLVQYVYGFTANEHVYFLTVQKKSHLPGQEELGYVSRISRSCISDANYDSYTEITLECLGGDGDANYNLLQDAKLVRAGGDLASGMGRAKGDLLLVAAFAPSEGHAARPEAASALCVYSVHDVEAKFSENTHMCFNGSMQYRNMEYISGPILDGKCPEKGALGNIPDFCEVGLKISGPVPVQGRAALTLPATLVTGVQATAAAAHTVVFLGTSAGAIKKVLLASTGEAAEYEEVEVDPGFHILPDMTFSKDRRFLYVISTSKASKVKVESCSSYTNCSSCLTARDPYCGWCSLEKRCTVQSACQKATFSSPRWLSFGSGQQCIDFEMILPDRLPVDQMATVQLTIRTLPELPAGAKYQCVWGAAPPADALVTASGLTCVTPAPSHRPPIAALQDHVLVPLSVRSSETNKDFVSRNFAFYDCGRHNTCGSCVRSSWACNWCVYENACTHNASSCRRTVISGESNPAQLSSHGSGFCPRFWADGSQLLAADGARSELQLLVENLPVPRVGQLGFQCVVSVEGATMLVGARVLDDDDDDEGGADGGGPTAARKGRVQRVVCEPTVYRYQSDEGEHAAALTLVWNGDHVVDGRQLTLYKCGVLGAHRRHQDCSLCVTRQPRFRCAWCGAACRYAPHCPGGGGAAAAASSSSAAAAAAPLLPPPADGRRRSHRCPTPRIDVIQPLAGPLEGGTLVTIEGSNLGLREADVRENIFIGDVPCAVHEYHVSVKIRCRTGPAPAAPATGAGPPQGLRFPVSVTTPSGTTKSTVRFTYTNVSVTGVWPTHGPASGGTVLSVSGRFLNVGSHVSATLDDLPCVVNKTRSSSRRLVCVTSRAPVAGDGGGDGGLPWTVRSLAVTVDGARRTLAAPFTYKPDPRVLELKPRQSPWSGGRLLTVHGTHLDSVQAPRITVLLHDRLINSSSCRTLGPDQMECPSPPVDRSALLALLRERRDAPGGPATQARASHKVSRSPRQNLGDSIALDVGFIMDNVASVRNLRHVQSSSVRSLLYVLDPTYKNFPNSIKLYKGDTLVIEGENLNLACDESDMNVTIGTRPCNVTSLALTQLVCTPPEVQPPPTDERGRPNGLGLPLVVVRMGQNLRFPIGYLRYEMIKEYQFPPEAVGGMAAGGVFLVLVSVIILVVYRRKSNQAEREYKRIQIQMDTLESNVRSECKQAFAELQTDMTDLTADLESSGIPTLDHRTYVMKVFFPGITDHPVLNDPKLRMNGCRPAVDSAMTQFEQLISNRFFLLAFIETLEAQKTFNIRDIVNVASLLVVAMAGRMEYLTEVLRLLLLRLIDKSVATKHPQLMLRRTESVVEKMLTNWMTLCMYTYLKEQAGPSLFLLFKAIKHQVEKGPVDALTHDARYSLSEERLLREQITHSYVSVAVVGEDGEKAQCRVLDCDTISQVKAKILDALYRNTPQSLRPSVHDVDLEWRHGRNGHLILADEDMTTKLDASGWRRLNTLAHYGVKDSALMALVHRPHDHHSLNNANCNAKCNSCAGFGVTGPGSPVNHCGEMESCRTEESTVYHLVKPVDHDSPHRSGEHSHKAIPEIFLTRLLSTKGTVQKFVDDFFRTVLTPNETLPPAIKWLFDLFDEAARRHGIVDPEVVLSWKSNSLPLRFWVNFIKNPDFVLDVHKSPTVDSCLSVIAQTFMDACSTTEHRLGKDSPSNKLLFAKDIARYKAAVRSFYQGVKAMPPVTDQDMAAFLHRLSLGHLGRLDARPALQELLRSYVARYYEEVVGALQVDPDCRSLLLAHKLDGVMRAVNGEPASLC